MPKTPREIENEGDQITGNTIDTNQTKNNVVVHNADIGKPVKKERVVDDAYLQRRYKMEEYMEGGEYDEFHSVVTTCRDEMKELQKTIKSTCDNTVAYGKKDLKFKTRTDKYHIAESLRAAIEHVEIALNHVRDAASGADNIWNDVIHDAMDLQDSRNNRNDPEDAIFEVL